MAETKDVLDFGIDTVVMEYENELLKWIRLRYDDVHDLASLAAALKKVTALVEREVVRRLLEERPTRKD